MKRLPSSSSASRQCRIDDGRLRLVFCLIAGLVPGFALAADWSRYVNVRFGYGVDVPPGFSAIREAENSDGGTATNSAGNAVLAVWGANLLDESFASDVGSRIASDGKESWTITYKLVTRSSASWTGMKDGRIFYARAVPKCRDRAAFARIEYDASVRTMFDPIVSRLARSLKATIGC